jgi:hypothetical protein
VAERHSVFMAGASVPVTARAFLAQADAAFGAKEKAPLSRGSSVMAATSPRGRARITMITNREAMRRLNR